MFGISKYSINTYFAVLVVTIIASGAAFIIVHVGTAISFPRLSGNEAQFSDLQKSILGK